LKKAIFLTGSMGSGKSTILKKSSFIEQKGIITRCQEYDILGLNQSGADTLSSYKKKEVFGMLAKEQSIEKLVIAGEYYSKQVDIERIRKIGFQVYCVLLNVDRNEVYKRVLSRGNGNWNELTYKTNMSLGVNFFRNFPHKKWIVKNNTYLEQKKAEDLLISI